MSSRYQPDPIGFGTVFGACLLAHFAFLVILAAIYAAFRFALP